MGVVARVGVGLMRWSARNGLAEPVSNSAPETAKYRARRTDIRGETYAYWYLRRRGYVMIARNFTSRGQKGEIDLVGYDGDTIAFVEVKTRTAPGGGFGLPEDAVTPEKRRHLSRIARQFLRDYHAQGAPYRFDVLAIEAPPGKRPEVQLHKGAFAA